MILISITLLLAVTVHAQQKECEQYDPALGPRGELSHLTNVQIGMPSDGYFQRHCVGILISSRFVLTAAQCTYFPGFKNPPLTVRLGENNDATATPIDVQIKNVYKHPDYKRPKKYNDVALLEIDPVNFTRYIQPACLSNYTKNTSGFTWANNISPTPKISVKDMQKVPLSVFDNKECTSLTENFKNRNWGGLNDGQICAIEIEKNPDMCSYSGAPIQVESDDQQIRIVGLLSFGLKCGGSRPSVYTRVSVYNDWIQSIVWPKK